MEIDQTPAISSYQALPQAEPRSAAAPAAPTAASRPAPAPAPAMEAPRVARSPPSSGAPAGIGGGRQERVHEAAEHEVSPGELSKWGEMVQVGIAQYMRTHPDRFHRRVRRGIPPRFRWQVWKAAVGLPAGQISDYSYHALCHLQNRWTSQIEIDISRTFPELKSFDAECQQRLLRVLNAYAGHNPAVGYCQGMNYVAGLLLIVSESEEESFAVLVRLMDQVEFGLGGFYREGLPLLKRYLKVCDKLVADTVPELREHFQKESVRPAMYLHQWFLSLFINCFPLSMVMIIWDVIICEGLPVILRIAVSILQVLKDSLLSMHFEEIIKFFKMMKTYDDEDGELNAFRIGQLLMKHTEHVQIPQEILEYLAREPDPDELASLDSDECWDIDLSGGSWLQSLSRMFMSPFKSSARRAAVGYPRAASAPELANNSAAAGAAAGSLTPPPQGSLVSTTAEGSTFQEVAAPEEDSPWEFL